MFIKEFLFQNLYYFASAVALISGLITYLYFYNREVLSFSGDPLELQKEERSVYISVDLSGAVERPGIYSLSPGDRLADLLSLSGGVTNEVSQKWLSRYLNLSAILRDQQKIYIPFEWEIKEDSASSFSLATLPPDAVPGEVPVSSPVGTSAPAEAAESSGDSGGADSVEIETSGEAPVSPVTTVQPQDASGSVSSLGDLVNLNTATQEELESLPRVGEVTAEKIIDNRPYANLAELEEKTDIYASTIEKIKGLVTF